MVTLVAVVIRPHLYPSQLVVDSAVEYCRTFLPQSDHTTQAVVMAAVAAVVWTMVIGIV